MSEKKIISGIKESLIQGDEIVVGPGDDCAAINVGVDKLMLIAADQLVGDVHYKEATTSATEIAKKLLNRNLSDIAAMGGIPASAILTVAAHFSNHSDTETWFNEFIPAINEEAKKWSVSICGGDIASTKSENVFTLTITGWVEREKLCLRSGAQIGDLIYSTGLFGNSFHSGTHLNFTPRIKEARFIAGDYSNTMMDVSDGLLSDLEQICESSNIGAVLDTASIPLREGATVTGALIDGEDYELLFSVNPEKSVLFEEKWPFESTNLSKIGHFTGEHRGVVYDTSGKNLSELTKKHGYDHFEND